MVLTKQGELVWMIFILVNHKQTGIANTMLARRTINQMLILMTTGLRSQNEAKKLVQVNKTFARPFSLYVKSFQQDHSSK